MRLLNEFLCFGLLDSGQSNREVNSDSEALAIGALAKRYGSRYLGVRRDANALLTSHKLHGSEEARGVAASE